MKRIAITPRKDFGRKLEEIGLSFHSWDNYWKEDACYQFSLAQVEEIEAATERLHFMCINAVKKILNESLMGKMGIPSAYHEAIKRSFLSDDFSVYGRFDLAYDGRSAPKMLEYNADTPTSLLESAVAQWYWMEDCFPDADQFNSLHEKLIERWKKLPGSGKKTLHLASLSENEEDWVCAMYMLDVATQAGIQAKHIFVEDIGWDEAKQIFVDVENNEIENLFKLYPWEWMMGEEFGKHAFHRKTRFVEPMWKSLLSNKAILPILWEMYPGDENLLPAYFSPDRLTNYVKKPFFSREGANIQVIEGDKKLNESDGPYESTLNVYQQYYEMPCFDNRYPIIGSWVVGGEPAGMCIREDVSQITTNMSNFVPHYIKD